MIKKHGLQAVSFGRKRKESSGRSGTRPVWDGTFDSHDFVLGDAMRGQRASLGRSLIDVNKEIGLPPYIVLAIEKGDLEAFNNPRLIGSYVLQYAKYLGMEPEPTYSRFCAETGYRRSRSGMIATVDDSFAGNLPHPTGKYVKAWNILADLTGRVLSYVFRGEFFVGFASVSLVMGLLAGGAYLSWTLYSQIIVGPHATATVQDTSLISSAGENPESVEVPFVRKQELGLPQYERLDPMIDIIPTGYGKANVQESAWEGHDSIFSVYSPPDKEMETEEDVIAAFLEDFTAIQPADDKIYLVSSEAAWVKVYQEDGTVLLERTLIPGQAYEVVETGASRILRTGNARNLYFVYRNTVYGPIGTGHVVDNIALAPADFSSDYDVATIDSFPDEVQRTLQAKINADHAGVTNNSE